MRRFWCFRRSSIRRVTWLVLAALPLIIRFTLISVTSEQRFTAIDAVPAKPVAIVFGAGLDNGAPSPMLAARLQQAAGLYQRGIVQKLLLTGDHSRNDYDEVSAMQHYAETLGVPTNVMTLDYAGFSTYDSCYRAKAIFGVQSAVLVTQDFHLPRAIFTCNALGLDVVGIETADQDSYPASVILPYRLREVFASSKAVWNSMWQPQPTFLGRFEGLR